VGTPFDTGTAIPRPTTRVGIRTAINDALVAAGWTRHNKSADRDVYESDGEDTTENICIEMNHLGSGQYLHFNIGPKLSAANEIEARIGNNVSTGGGSDTNGRWDLTAFDFTADGFILVTKDHLFAAFQNVNHSSQVQWVSIGLGKRTNILNPNKYTVVNNPVAGDQVVLDVTGSGNPLADGYRPGGVIGIVETAKIEAVQARRLMISEVTPTSFTVLHLPVDFHAGALVGAQPSPLFRGVSNNEVPDDATVWSSPLWPITVYAGARPASAQPLADQGEMLATVLSVPNGAVLNEVHFSSNAGFSSSGEYGSGGTPNQRTQRFTCRNFSLAFNDVEIHSVHPNLVAFPGTVGLYPHDWFLADRLTPNRYYVGFRPTSSTSERWGVGPTS
jgi:hypothetical protein